MLSVLIWHGAQAHIGDGLMDKDWPVGRHDIWILACPGWEQMEMLVHPDICALERFAVQVALFPAPHRGYSLIIIIANFKRSFDIPTTPDQLLREEIREAAHANRCSRGTVDPIGPQSPETNVVVEMAIAPEQEGKVCVMRTLCWSDRQGRKSSTRSSPNYAESLNRQLITMQSARYSCAQDPASCIKLWGAW